MRRLEVARRLDPSIVTALRRLLDAAARERGHRAVDEDRWHAMVDGSARGAIAVVAWDDRQPVAHGQATRDTGGWALDLALDPPTRAADPGLGPAVIRSLLEAVADEGGGRVQLWVRAPGPADDAEARAGGLPEQRDLYQMRRPLPVELPTPGLDVRPFRADADADAWLAVNNRAFAWHPEQGGWDAATLRQRLGEPWYDPAGFLVHERDGRLAGFCWTKAHRDESPPLGEIFVIAVDPDVQGFGLGRDLVLAGLDHLAGRGLSVAMLYVDAANTPAVRLYQGLGFDVHHVDRAYGATVSP